MKSVYRILDANFNRCREGLRVAEEVARFSLDRPNLSGALKKSRHAVTGLYKKMDPAKLLLARNSEEDVGRGFSVLERRRRDLAELFWANLERAKESLRVLEEASKLVAPELSPAFKQIRFRVYEIEKRAYRPVEALCDRRPGRGPKT